MRRLAIIAALAAGACAAPAPPAAPPAPVPAGGVTTISGADLASDLYAFADDSMRGRDAETGDAVRAARFLAARAAAAGLEPAGDSGYLQRVPLVREYITAASNVTLTGKSGSQRLPLSPQLVPLPSLGDSEPLPKLDAEGDLIFGGYALSDSDGELAGRSIAGKVVVFLMSDPPGFDSVRRAEIGLLHPPAERIARLVERAPAAIVMIVSGRGAALLPAAYGELRDSSVRLAESLTPRTRTLPMVLLCEGRASAPFLPDGWPVVGKRATLAGRRLSAHVVLVRRAVPAFNVVGVRRGADPALRNTYVAFGAHLDHIGIQTPVGGDSIANGADDDGSGSVALVAIARAAVTQRPAPKRSMLFVWHTGEELGLYGSEWFTTHPTVPLDSIIAQLNADMIGRNARDSLYLVGPNAAPHGQSLQLGRIADSVNATLRPPFEINREWDSPTHPEQIYYRSDHYNYARNGIPVLFFTSGLHADYHKVSDEPKKIEFDKLARVAAYIYDVGLAVANRPGRLVPARANIEQ